MVSDGDGVTSCGASKGGGVVTDEEDNGGRWSIM